MTESSFEEVIASLRDDALRFGCVMYLVGGKTEMSDELWDKDVCAEAEIIIPDGICLAVIDDGK